MRKLIFFGLTVGFATTASVAFAQYPPPPPPPPAGYGYAPPMAPAPAPRLRFGSPGELAISSSVGGANLLLTGTTTGGVNGSPSSSGWNLTLEPSADYFVIQNLSVGAFVVFTHAETNTPSTTPGETSTSTSTSTNTFGVGPRIGYNLALTDWLSLWPKLGLSYSDTGVSGGASHDAWTLVVFAPLLYHLASHYFVGLGPYLSADLAANGSSGGANSQSGPYPKQVVYGLRFTIGGWFTP